MSEDTGEKRFDATPSRIEKARREGNAARSQEFGVNCAFLAGALATIAIAPLLGAYARAALTLAAHGKSATGLVLSILACGFFPVAASAIGGIGASLVQTGGLVVTPLRWDLSKLSFAQGIRRMVSRDTLAHGIRALVAFGVAATVLLFTLRDALAMSSFTATPVREATLAWSGAQHAAFAAAVVGLTFAIAEYGVVRRAWLLKLKMSLYELKRDFKEREGDPHARAQRKSFHRSLLRGSIARVKDAAFVVVNPTHISIALEYRPPDVPVPVVLVRATDEGALRVREEAKALGIPLVENVPLARALFAQSEVGAAIPYDHYVAVAEIVAALSAQGALS